MKDYTDEFSFILKASKHGVGVFAAHPIKAGTLLNLLGKNHDDFMEREKDSVPEVFQSYCLQYGNGKVICPKDFSRMSVEWFINHASQAEATVVSKDGVHHYAARDIKEGEEITIDYNVFNEDENLKEDYYTS